MSAATILTLKNGKGVDLLNPQIDISDFDSFAEHLAKEKRYNGATPGVEYSVAEHQVRGVDAILAATGDKDLAAYFSLHDCHEGTLKDLTTPLKEALAEIAAERFGVLAPQIVESFKLLEYRHDVAIHHAAGMLWPMPAHFIKEVKRWDLIMFVTEWRDLMLNAPHPNWAPYSGIVPLTELIEPWCWETAKAALLNRWRVLLPAFRTYKPAHEQGGSLYNPRWQYITDPELTDFIAFCRTLPADLKYDFTDANTCIAWQWRKSQNAKHCKLLIDDVAALFGGRGRQVILPKPWTVGAARARALALVGR